MPEPRLYTISSEQPNAFATTRSPKHAAVAAREGLLHHLRLEQVEGVLAPSAGARWTQIPTYACGMNNPDTIAYIDERLRPITEPTKGDPLPGAARCRSPTIRRLPDCRFRREPPERA